MFCVIGLGNPEKRYRETRHNLGFDVVDHLASRLNLRFQEGKGEFHFARGSAGETALVLAKPMTYMNNSGIAVAEISEQFEVPLEQMLVVCDDFQLPLGQLRLRLQGSDGGHNGLYSIIYHLQSDLFPRLRCGIASPSMPKEKDRLADFVLERFTAEELPAARQMVGRASDACLLAVEQGPTAAMNEFNKKVETENDSPNL